MTTRKPRRADGQLRPAVRRYRARRAGREREAWLAQFAPGARERFFNHVRLSEAVFLSGFARLVGLDRPAAARLLEMLGEERRWRKLRTLDGLVVGIAPPRRRPAAEVASPVPTTEGAA